MSLKNCPSCHQQVSSDAGACPHCGAKLKFFWGTWKSFAMGFASYIIGIILDEMAYRGTMSHTDKVIGAVFAYFGMGSIVVSIVFAVARFVKRHNS